jgi:hypothetical protein
MNAFFENNELLLLIHQTWPKATVIMFGMIHFFGEHNH